jgi:UDP-N-acetylglucosamine 2-epimerase (non-hydrolysing)
MSYSPVKKVMVIFGTRPEAIKMAPIIQVLRKRLPQGTQVCATAQHRQMQDQALAVFDIKPDFDLDLMRPGQSLNDVVSRVLQQLSPVLEQQRPDYILVQGDTSTAFAAALAAFHLQIKVGHVEAGLRTGDRTQPYPEEVNRKMLSCVADKHFAPTSWSKQNLLDEGYPEESIYVTGNTVIDALYQVLQQTEAEPIAALQNLADDAPMILITGHRRENFGSGFDNICHALKHLAEKYPSHHFVYPVHLNPNVQKPVLSLLGNIANIHLIDPQPYVQFVHLMQRSLFLISDSGGIQEEATALGKAVLVMRSVTERPEGIDAGVCQLVGTDKDKIIREASSLIDNPEKLAAATQVKQLFGDGHAAEYIIDALLAPE